MKKAISRARIEPSAASLREMPEVDFTRVRVRRNPYAAEGIAVAHEGPSEGSLADIPEVDFAQVRVRRSSYVRGAPAVLRFKARRGRPKKGQETGPTPTRSIRLPTTMWDALERAAREANVTVHALLRLAVTHLLEAPPPAARARGSAVRSRRRRLDSAANAGDTRTATPRRRAGRARRRW